MAPGSDPVSGTPRAQEAFDAALNAHDAGDMALAESKYRQAIAADRNMTVAYNNLGMILIQQERMDEAVDSLRRAVEIEPGYAEAYNNLGFAYRRLGMDPEAADQYEKFLELTPDVEEAIRIREWIVQVRQSGAAVAGPAPDGPPADAGPVPAAGADAGAGDGSAFSDFFQSGPADAGVPVPEPSPIPDAGGGPAEPPPAGPAEDGAGLSNKAEEEFAALFGGQAEAGAAAPAEAAFDEEVGQLYSEAMTKFQDGDLGEAVRFCSLALEKAPGHFPTLLLAGRVALGRQDCARATAQFQKAIEVKPEEPEALFFLAQCYEKRGLLDEAREAYGRCLKMAPGGPRAKRIQQWLEKQLPAGGADAPAARCDLCLRSVQESDLSAHEGRRVCKACLETLGPRAEGKAAAQPQAQEVDRRTGKRVTVRRRGRGARAVLVLLVLAVLGAVAWAGLGRAGYIKLPDAVARLVGVKPPKPVGPRLPPVRVTPGTARTEPVDVSFEPMSDGLVRPMDRWVLRPRVKLVWAGGSTAAPAGAEPVRFEVARKPDGLVFDAETGEMSWTPGLAGSVDVPSEHQIEFRAVCGKKSTPMRRLKVGVRYDVPVPREYDLRMPGCHSASRWALTFVDLDGDSRPDVAAASGGPLAGQLSLLRSGGEGAGLVLAPPWTFSCGPAGLAAGDLDGDGRQDLACPGWADGLLHFLRGTPGTAPGRPVRVGSAGGPVEGTVLADLDGDGRSELVVVSRFTGRVTAFTERGTRLAEAALAECVLPPLPVVMPELPGRKGQRLGLVYSRGREPGRMEVWGFRDGKLQTEQKLELPVGVVWAACSGDFDGGGREGVALLYGGQPGAVLLLEAGDSGRLSPRSPVELAGPPVSMCAGDINGDGRADLVISSTDSIRYYLSAGGGRLMPVATQQLAGLAGPVALWPSKDRRTALIAALTLKGRVWVGALPGPLTAPAASSAPVEPVVPAKTPARPPRKGG